jgi:hypothetical protein
MVYDNTIFNAAFKAWIKANVDIGFGQEYAGDLLDDFCEYVAEMGMMKASPGRVVFGRALAGAGLEKRKSLGLTNWIGLKLKKPRITRPKRYSKTLVEEATEAREREEIQTEIKRRKSPEGQQEALAEFHQKMAEEDAAREALENENV